MAFQQTRNDIIAVWFRCRLCEGSFQEVEQFIRHKRDWHPLDFEKTNCIIFEEKSVTPDLESSESEQYELPFASNNNSDANSLPAAEVGYELAGAGDVTAQLPVPVTVRVKQERAFAQLLTHESLEENQDDDEPNTDAPFDVETFADDSVHVNSLNDEYPENPSVPPIFLFQQPNPVESLSPIFENATEEDLWLQDPIVLVEYLSLEQLQTASNYNPANLKQLKCPVQNCFASFRRQYELTRHSAHHTDHRPFKCHHQGCSKAFKAKRSLRKHAAVHTDSALPRSVLIKKFFKKRLVTKFPFNVNRNRNRPTTALRKGLQNQKENASFKCGVPGCSARFHHKSSLKRHQRKTGHSNQSGNPIAE